MLVTLLKNRGVAPFFIAMAIAIALLLWTFFSTQPTATDNQLLFSHWAFGWLHKQHTGKLLIGLILILLSVVLVRFNSQLQRNAQVSGNIAMLVFLSLVFTQNNILHRPDILSANLAVVALFNLLFSTQEKGKVLSQLFHVGLLFAIAFFLVGQSVLLVVAVYFSLIIMRSGSWREWFVPLLGAAMMVVFLFLFLVWSQNPFLQFQQLIQTSWVKTFTMANISIGHYALSVVFLITVPNTLQALTSGSASERNHLLSLLGWITVALLCVPVLGLGWQSALVFAAFPLSIFIARALQEINRWWLSDLLLISVLIAPFFSRL